jgi:hypothetical protein
VASRWDAEILVDAAIALDSSDAIVVAWLQVALGGLGFLLRPALGALVRNCWYLIAELQLHFMVSYCC